MNTPRIVVDLDRVHDNTTALVDLLGRSGISVTAVTKATLGLPAVANTLLDAGAARLADSRVENIERMRRAGIDAPILLLRSPMVSQVDRVVRSADLSCNTEASVLDALSVAATAAGVTHGVVVMVELGDLREGVRPEELNGIVEHTLGLPGLRLTGIGTNLACRNGIVPDDRNMHELSGLAVDVETLFDLTLDIVSGGNSANLDWLMAAHDTGRVNDLRLGESILLGCEPLHRRPIRGLHTDAVTIVAEVIESKRKPTLPTGDAAQAAFGAPAPAVDRGEIWQTIVAIGRQDTDTDGLAPPAGVAILGASSDHLVLETTRRMAPGETICFHPAYGALVRAMTSPFVHRTVRAAPTDRL